MDYRQLRKENRNGIPEDNDNIMGMLNNLLKSSMLALTKGLFITFHFLLLFQIAYIASIPPPAPSSQLQSYINTSLTSQPNSLQHGGIGKPFVGAEWWQGCPPAHPLAWKSERDQKELPYVHSVVLESPVHSSYLMLMGTNWDRDWLGFITKPKIT